MKYELDKKTLKKYLKYQRSKTNIIFIIIGSLIYFYITYYLILNNPFITFIYYLLYLLIIITLKSDKIILNVNNNTYEYLNSNIKKIKKYQNFIVIKYSNHISLFFIKDLIGNNYNELQEMI